MTISEFQANALATETPTVSREAAERVVDYLVFHKALIGETSGRPAILERYLSLVENLKEGVHVIIPDPFQKATALLFELVMEEEFDPWEIDLVRFTEVYLARVREEGGINFAVAGRLLYMAWSILYLQSQELLRARDTPTESAVLDAADPADESYLSDLSTPEAVDVTSAILDGPSTNSLTPMVRHPETRPVSLIELVQAFSDAEVEARRALRVQELRERLREEQRAPPEVLVHGDIPERDLADAWASALRHPMGEPFPMLELWRPEQGRDRLVSLFLATLFLARERAIELRQEQLGESALFLVRTLDARPEKLPED
jgi:segregation and condensation protein A